MKQAAKSLNLASQGNRKEGAALYIDARAGPLRLPARVLRLSCDATPTSPTPGTRWVADLLTKRNRPGRENSTSSATSWLSAPSLATHGFFFAEGISVAYVSRGGPSKLHRNGRAPIVATQGANADDTRNKRITSETARRCTAPRVASKRDPAFGAVSEPR